MKLFDKIKEGFRNFNNMLEETIPQDSNSEEILASYPDLMNAQKSEDAFANNIAKMVIEKKGIKGINKIESTKSLGKKQVENDREPVKKRAKEDGPDLSDNFPM